MSMDNTYELEVDQVAVALTKPSTRFGVPHIPFYLNMMIWLMGWMIYQAISGSTSLLSMFVFGSLYVVCHLVMYFLTLQDTFGLMLTWLNLTHFRKHPTRKSWGNTDSFAS